MGPAAPDDEVPPPLSTAIASVASPVPATRLALRSPEERQLRRGCTFRTRFARVCEAVCEAYNSSSFPCGRVAADDRDCGRLSLGSDTFPCPLCQSACQKEDENDGLLLSDPRDGRRRGDGATTRRRRTRTSPGQSTGNSTWRERGRKVESSFLFVCLTVSNPK